MIKWGHFTPLSRQHAKQLQTQTSTLTCLPPDHSPTRSNPGAHGPVRSLGGGSGAAGTAGEGGRGRKQNQGSQGRSKRVSTEIPLAWECARAPGKEAQMKGGAAGGKQAMRTEGQLFRARPGAAPRAAGPHCGFVR